jgi:hypothetical protein
MKTLYATLATLFFVAFATAQTAPFARVHNILQTKCSNSSCHSTNSGANLKFDGTETEVHAALFEVKADNSASNAKFEKRVKAGHPYMSFLLRKVAGAGFDTDLALDANEGSLMVDINGNQLAKAEIEFIRQWIMFGGKKTYGSSDRKPDWNLVNDYYNDPNAPAFLPKPTKPAAGQGLQYRHGPVFLPATGEIEQEWLLQQEVNFPYLPEISKIEGYMNQQSHHFLLFKFDDSLAAAARTNNYWGMQIVKITGTNSFEGDKILTASWQDDAEFTLPTKTALFWDKKAYLDMNYHIKNYNATSVLPCDFYFNILFEPRKSSTIEMKAALVNNVGLFLPQGNQTRDYDDQANNLNTPEWRYIWSATSHTHKYGSDYDLYIRDTTGTITDKIYEGFYDYANNYDKGYYDWEHPSTRYWDNLLPVKFGKHGSKKAGLVARTSWVITEPFVSFGFTTEDEMQLYYYFYTDQPLENATAINEVDKNIFFTIYPNPMNGNGKLTYHLDKSALVSANIVDISGKEVALMSPTQQESGTHLIELDANKQLSPGIYFAKLTVDGSVYSKKFVVTE